MSVTTPQGIVILRVPTYSGDPRLDDMETLAAAQTGTVFGSNRNLAIALLMLHTMSLDDSRGGGASGGGAVTGSVKSEKEGDLSRAYSASSGSGSAASKHPDLSQTIYGLELIALRNANILNPRNRMLGEESGTFSLPTIL